jgi:hypothetical protein
MHLPVTPPVCAHAETAKAKAARRTTTPVNFRIIELDISPSFIHI